MQSNDLGGRLVKVSPAKAAGQSRSRSQRGGRGHFRFVGVMTSRQAVSFFPSRSMYRFVSAFAVLLLLELVAAQDPIFSDCYDSDNYTAGGRYQSNLNAILPSLASNAVANLTTYYSTTVGGAANRIYGFAQCMSAAAASDCAACFNQSTVGIVRACPNKMKAVIGYTNCTLRYSNESFVSVPDSAVRMSLFNVQNVTNSSAFNSELSSMLRNLTNEAQSVSSRFAVGSVSYSFSDIYGLTQCTRDLSSRDCFSCLRTVISEIQSCCNDKRGAQIYSPSCNIRYETYPFYPAFGLAPPPQQPATSPPPSSSTSQNPSKSNRGNGSTRRRRRTTVIAVTCGVAGLLLVCTVCVSLTQRRKKAFRKIGRYEDDEIVSTESVLFDLYSLKVATNNFSEANKLGQGGFGPVYKGTLPAGQEIAVKRLLTGSGQGIAELRTEIALIAKLQHRNLVRLLGCCLEDQEKLLVYEYLPNTSLDKFIFDSNRRAQVNWQRRYSIIGGIARGLLYLHEDSRLRIIHRDLKASNILLDSDMNPKISDFGMAKIFGGDQTGGETGRIAGTYGYMAPEYAMHGQFSTKSDVYSFGVLVLEIVTGRKSYGFSEAGGAVDLLNYVWRNWTGQTAFNMVDPSIVQDCNRDEVVRCIHMGLLCVQEDPNERPTMSTIVLIFGSRSLTLPAPSPPAFCDDSRTC